MTKMYVCVYMWGEQATKEVKRKQTEELLSNWNQIKITEDIETEEMAQFCLKMG